MFRNNSSRGVPILFSAFKLAQKHAVKQQGHISHTIFSCEVLKSSHGKGQVVPGHPQPPWEGTQGSTFHPALGQGPGSAILLWLPGILCLYHLQCTWQPIRWQSRDLFDHPALGYAQSAVGRGISLPICPAYQLTLEAKTTPKDPKITGGFYFISL